MRDRKFKISYKNCKEFQIKFTLLGFDLNSNMDIYQFKEIGVQAFLVKFGNNFNDFILFSGRFCFYIYLIDLSL